MANPSYSRRPDRTIRRYDFFNGLITSADDGQSFVFTGRISHQIRRCNLTDGRVSTLIGGAQGFKNGDSNSTRFNYPTAICTDPLSTNNLFIGDKTSIRYWDTATDQVTLIAGDAKGGYVDGVGVKARFSSIHGLLCHPNGRTLFVCDALNHRIRMVDIASRLVTTIAGDGKTETRDGTGLKCSLHSPQQIVFDRSLNVKPNSVLLITSGSGPIRRFNTETGVLTTLKLNINATPFNPMR